MEDIKEFLAEPGQQVRLKDFNTDTSSSKPDKKDINDELQLDIDGIATLQYKLYAENKRSLLIILQGMDGSGKDSAIRHIMTGVNPQGVDVHSFKEPTSQDLQYDFFWRHHVKMPPKGMIGIFNRSYYENVLITKVHPELILNENIPGINSVDQIDELFWQKRYQQINNFEQMLVENGTFILKFFLHLSKKEQRKRFLKRLEEREKNWKFSASDIKERAYWEDYQAAYETAINQTSTVQAPWYIIPADSKWFSHLLMGKIILITMKQLNPHLPEITEEEKLEIARAEKLLEEKDNH